MSETKKRNTHLAEFKAKVGLQAVRGVKTVNQIAQEFGVHPVQVGQWKREIQAHAKTLFEGKRGPQPICSPQCEAHASARHALLPLLVRGHLQSQNCGLAGVRARERRLGSGLVTRYFSAAATDQTAQFKMIGDQPPRDVLALMRLNFLSTNTDARRKPFDRTVDQHFGRCSHHQHAARGGNRKLAYHHLLGDRRSGLHRDCCSQ